LVSGYQKPIFYLIGASLVGAALGLYIFVTFMVVPEPVLIRGQKPSCAEPEPKSTPDTIEPTAYRNETIGFSINPPKGWHAIASSSTFKAELNEADSPRMEIRRYQMGGATADAASELAITAVAEGLPIIDHQILEKKAIMVGDKNASRTVAGIWIQDKGLVKVMIVIIDYGDTQWVITGRSWNMDYPLYRNTFFTSIQTFKAD
ncbi:MAG: hypothetical protein HY762_09710, partial [Planctomycetes bacterium]|nr:hypothetical protein [Planctomycetota bacterium]